MSRTKHSSNLTSTPDSIIWVVHRYWPGQHEWLHLEDEVITFFGKMYRPIPVSALIGRKPTTNYTGESTYYVL